MQKYSKLFGKTSFNAKENAATIVGHQLLTKAGFICESVAGRYFLLPLGWKVHEKIKKIIKEEMDKTGAQEMLSPTLHPLELWAETNRNNSVGFELMKVTDQRGADFVLGGTGEEMFVDVARKLKLSYKDLPINIYQFSNKFRDERRARGGLLRVREFIMKDAYSFDIDEDAFKIQYEQMAYTYSTIFERCGLKTLRVAADNGYIGGEYCHEYQVECEIGEGRFFISEDGKYIAHEDIAKFKRDDINLDEDIKQLEKIKQPEWVKTMADNEKHYKLPASRFLKNVVFKDRQNGEIYIVVIRGDLEVNKTKFEHVLDKVGLLDDATDEDLETLGTQPGYVHSWGYKNAKFYGDLSLKTVRNFIGGHKTKTTDTINVNYGVKEFDHGELYDLAMAQDGFTTEDGKSILKEKRGIEVGNIFQLGYHYSHKMKDAVFAAADGSLKPYYMGCYGIGIGRTLAAIVELNNDKNGIIWPKSVAPYHIHLINIGADNLDAAQTLATEFEANGYEVLWDDRDVSPGQKFVDADLIGIAVRVVVSKKSLEKGGYEVKERISDKSEIIPKDKIVSWMKGYYEF